MKSSLYGLTSRLDLQEFPVVDRDLDIGPKLALRDDILPDIKILNSSFRCVLPWDGRNVRAFCKGMCMKIGDWGSPYWLLRNPLFLNSYMPFEIFRLPWYLLNFSCFVGDPLFKTAFLSISPKFKEPPLPYTFYVWYLGPNSSFYCRCCLRGIWISPISVKDWRKWLVLLDSQALLWSMPPPMSLHSGSYFHALIPPSDC